MSTGLKKVERRTKFGEIITTVITNWKNGTVREDITVECPTPINFNEGKKPSKNKGL